MNTEKRMRLRASVVLVLLTMGGVAPDGHAACLACAGSSPPPPVTVGIPRNLRVVARTTSTVTLRWDAPLTGSWEQYRLERMAASGTWDLRWMGTTRQRIDPVVRRTHYCWRVRATLGSQVSAPSNIVCGKAR